MPITIQTGVPRVPPDPVQEKKRRRQLIFRISLGTTFLLVCLALMLRMWAYESVLVISSSMEPAVFKGDYMLLDHRVILRGNWRRGDIIVFKAPEEWTGTGQTLVKRVIGLPGETVQMRAGTFRINNRPLSESNIAQAQRARDDDTFPITLGPREYFVSGDNRANSDDSRANGPISGPDIQGRALGVLWPPPHMGALQTPNYIFEKEIAE